MIKGKLKLAFYLVFLLVWGCGQSDEIIVNSQITCIHTNTYLVYSKQSKIAAIIDVAGPIDSLLSIVSNNNLQVKYFLFTHSHFDHVMGLPEIKKKFPNARICISKQAYEDMLIQKE